MCLLTQPYLKAPGGFLCPDQAAEPVDRIAALVSRLKSIPAGGGLLALAVAVAVVPVLAGCGVSSQGDFDRGKQLFAAKCATCHTLRDAGSSATVGPNLDAAFSQARAAGMDPQTIAGVVKDQVENPRPSTTNPAVSMPSDLLSGGDLDDVASYIGEVAGNPRFKGPQLPNLPGAKVFATAQPSACSSCHTLAAAGSTATTGPNLDDVIGTVTKTQGGQDDLKTAAGIKQAITDPEKTIAPGYPSGVMPSTFGQSITPQDLDALVQFLIQCHGKGANTKPCQPPTNGKK
jgi:mono/diheme cytochrome c family protein